MTGAGIYAKCAELLLRKWDDQRDLYRKLGSDHLVEPTLRYLAWWLLTREDSQTAATERELIAKAAEFLYGRGYETEDEATPGTVIGIVTLAVHHITPVSMS